MLNKPKFKVGDKVRKVFALDEDNATYVIKAINKEKSEDGFFVYVTQKIEEDTFEEAEIKPWM